MPRPIRSRRREGNRRAPSRRAACARWKSSCSTRPAISTASCCVTAGSTARHLERGADRRAPLHVDAAAHAALLAVSKGKPGVYNIAEDDGAVTIDKARTELGFSPAFRIRSAAF